MFEEITNEKCVNFSDIVCEILCEKDNIFPYTFSQAFHMENFHMHVNLTCETSVKTFEKCKNTVWK